MTPITNLQCNSFCIHYKEFIGFDVPFGIIPNESEISGHKCTAFPKGIPNEIINERHDHRKPYEGDNGVQFKAIGDPEKINKILDEYYEEIKI